MNARTLFSSINLLAGVTLLGWTSLAAAQPTFGNPSPTAGRETSQKANAAADQAAYRPVEYTNVNKKGPALIVLPGDIKSNNATFMQKFTANNIADFGEVELSAANFQVLERSNLGPVLNEFTLAYNLGDPDAARKFLRMGKLKSTKYVVKFDILKAEQIAQAQQGFDGGTLGQMAGLLGAYSHSVGGARRCGGRYGDRIRSLGRSDGRLADRNALQDHQRRDDGAGRDRLRRRKMEVGAKSSSVLGVSQSEQGGVGLDTMVQRLIQKSVWEIDNKYK